MINKKTQFAKKNRTTVLPSKMAIVVNDIIAIFCFALSIMLGLALATYSSADRCWSKNIDSTIIHNKLGISGSYFADMSYYIFGVSSCWIVLGLFYLGYCKIIRNKIEVGNWYNLLKMISFLLLLLSSSVFEYMSFAAYNSNLPNGFGGGVGEYIYNGLAHLCGSAGAAIFILALFILSLSFTFGISWGNIAEKTGRLLEVIYSCFKHIISRRDENLADKKDKRNKSNTSPEMSNMDNDEEIDANLLLFNEDDEEIDSSNNPRQYKRIISEPEKIIPPKKATKNAVKSSNANQEIDLLNSSTLELLPSTNLLSAPKKQVESISEEMLEFVSVSIENKLAEFGVEAKITNAESGPVITRYELLPAKGVRGDKIVSLGKEIARGLALTNVRIVETIPGKNSMGLEVPNFKRQTIYLKEIFDSSIYQHSASKLTLALGKDIAGEVVVTDLAKMPHLLVAGTTGSGKSVAVNAMILSILFKATPDEVKFIMIDPKMVELSFYQDIPHLLAPVVTDMTQAANALKWAVGEMERRYKTMAKVGAKNIVGFNHKITDATNNGQTIGNPFSLTPDDPEALETWPYIVIIIDELADLMMVAGKKIEQYIARIAQKARAVGIHLIVATQRPSVDVITGLIKANIPARIAFQVSSKIDSRTILDQMGAETLLGMGDMLFLQPGTGFPQRIHGAYVNDDELNQVVAFLKSTAAPNYVDEVLNGLTDGEFDFDGESSNDNDPEKDSMFDESVKFMLDSKRCSISSLQTRFGIGYNRAARIMNQMEMNGMVKRTERGSYELVKVF